MKKRRDFSPEVNLTRSIYGLHGDSLDVDTDAAQRLQKPLRTVLDAMLASFPEHKRRHADVVRQYYGWDNGTGVTYATIARQFGVTPARIRQLNETALYMLRNPQRLSLNVDGWTLKDIMRRLASKTDG